MQETEAPSGAFPHVWQSKPVCWDSHENVLSNIRSSLARKLTPFLNCPLIRPDRAVVVSSSYSLADRLEDVRREKSEGNVLFSINQAHDYLIENGIIPDYCVTLDTHADLADVITPHPEVTYLIASMCSPKVFDLLDGFKVVLWHAWNDGPESEAIRESDIDVPLVWGGPTAALRCINVGYLMGFRDFAFYGLDSSLKDGRNYAHQSRYTNAFHYDEVPVECAGKVFQSTRALISQAECFALIFDRFGSSCELNAYGDGLIPHMSEILNRKKKRLKENQCLQKQP